MTTDKLKQAEAHREALLDTQRTMTSRRNYLTDKIKTLEYPASRGDKVAKENSKLFTNELATLKGELEETSRAIDEAEAAVKEAQAELAAEKVEALKAEHKAAEIRGLEAVVIAAGLRAQTTEALKTIEAAQKEMATLAAELSVHKQTVPSWGISLGSDERQKAEALARLKELQKT